MKHLFESHSSAPIFKYTCGLSGCVQTFKTYSAYASHWSRSIPTDSSPYVNLAGMVLVLLEFQLSCNKTYDGTRAVR